MTEEERYAAVRARVKPLVAEMIAISRGNLEVMAAGKNLDAESKASGILSGTMQLVLLELEESARKDTDNKRATLLAGYALMTAVAAWVTIRTDREAAIDVCDFYAAAHDLAHVLEKHRDQVEEEAEAKGDLGGMACKGRA